MCETVVLRSAESGLRAEVERVLRENGLTDRPDQYDSSIHSWRCEHPDRYGPCSCFAELVDDLTRVLSPGEHHLEGVACSCGGWEARLGESIHRGFDQHLLSVLPPGGTHE